MDSDSQGVKFIMRDGMGVRKDASSAKKKDKSQLNMNVLRKSALALLNQAKYGRLSKRKEDNVQSSP